jgi:drug/metabolite transporter (DMT)-like permease
MITRKAPNTSGIAINGLAMALSTIIFAPFALTHLPAQTPSTNAILATVGLGIICTAFAFWVFFLVLDEIGAARASLVVYPNTAVAVVLGIFLLNESITLAIAIGLPLVLLGSYFASRKPAAPVIAG